ncbi:helix-turn-helix transcriptional regulator [Vibrio mediterranei]|uniref:helix-turn-helix transcriptional regulator n=1 Tax=Vibrio mediterranei TaxID=689 RepID=UPI0038CEA109
MMSKKEKDLSINIIRRKEVVEILKVAIDFEVLAYSDFSRLHIPYDMLSNRSSYDYVNEKVAINILVVMAEKLNFEEFVQTIEFICRVKLIPLIGSVFRPGDKVSANIERLFLAMKKASLRSELSLEYHSGKAYLTQRKTLKSTDGSIFLELFNIIYLIELICYLSGESWKPSIIGIQSTCHSRFKRIRALRGSTFFVCRSLTSISISERLLKKTTSVLDHYHYHSFPIQDDLKNIDFPYLIELTIKPYASDRKFNIDSLSTLINVNKRTIQRKLKEHGTNFSEIFNRLFFREVKKLLVETELPIFRMAILLGYSNSGHFIRSFKKYCRISPHQYRLLNTSRKCG